MKQDIRNMMCFYDVAFEIADTYELRRATCSTAWNFLYKH